MRKGFFAKFQILLIMVLALTATMPAFSFASFKNSPNPIISAENIIQLTSSTSKHVKITGVVCSSVLSDNSKVVFLNFGNNFNTSLSAVIYDFDFQSFADAGIDQPEKYFRNKKVSLEGIVRIANGKPEIVISSPKQIKIIE